MINYKEVRSGNYLRSFLTKEIVEVTYLHLKHLEDGNIQSVYQHDIIVYEPIALTEEELLNLGFFFMSEEDWKKLPMFGSHFEQGWFSPSFENCAIKLTKEDGKFYYCTHHQGLAIFRKMEIRSVHQLQNLYYSISNGQELSYKTKKSTS